METGEKMKQFISDLIEQNTTLSRDKESLKAAYQKLSDEFIKLHTLCEEREGNREALLNSQLALQNEQLRKEINDLRDAFEKEVQIITLEKQSLLKNNSSLEERLENLIMRLLVAEDFMARRQNHVDQLKAKHNLLLITCTKQQETILEIEAHNEDIQTKLALANEQLKTMTAEHEAERAEFQSEMQSITKDLCDAQSKIKSIEDCRKVSNEKVQITERKIGTGAFGNVFEGHFCHQKVAVKQLFDIIVSNANIEKILNEIHTMSRLRHPNLLLFIAAVCDQEHNPLIITELMDMSLREAYEKKLLTSEREKLVILRDAAAGLNYLHCLPDPIIHRDVSSANVLLAPKGPGQWIVKVSDFGSAKLAREAKTANPGAVVYSAPEAFSAITESQRERKQTTKLDVYSFGILLCEVMTCQFPSNCSMFDEMMKQVSTTSPLIYDLICCCTQKQPGDCPEMVTVIKQLDSQLSVT